MQPEKKKLIKKWILVNIIVLALIAIASVIAILWINPCYGESCYKRGELLGQGIGNLLVFGNLVAGGIYYWKKRKREKEQGLK